MKYLYCSKAAKVMAAILEWDEFNLVTLTVQQGCI